LKFKKSFPAENFILPARFVLSAVTVKAVP